MKSTITEMKTHTHTHTYTYTHYKQLTAGNTEERISDLEDTVMEIAQ